MTLYTNCCCDDAVMYIRIRITRFKRSFVLKINIIHKSAIEKNVIFFSRQAAGKQQAGSHK